MMESGTIIMCGSHIPLLNCTQLGTMYKYALILQGERERRSSHMIDTQEFDKNNFMRDENHEDSQNDIMTPCQVRWKYFQLYVGTSSNIDDFMRE